MKESVRKYCPKCELHMGFEIVDISYATKGQSDLTLPHAVLVRCPECDGSSIWVLYRFWNSDKQRLESYRLLEFPGEGILEIPGLPNDPPALKKAYFEAVRSLEGNNFMAAATMFRRAIQVITRDILGAKRGVLANELKELKGKSNKLGATLSKDFHDNSYIIRELANQAAHPDGDIDLIDFGHEDAKSLYELFLEIVGELFVIPEARERARRDLLARRKIVIPVA